jgi:hypothetical protein
LRRRIGKHKRIRTASAQRFAINYDPLNLIERVHVSRAIVELGRARALMSGHGLGVLKGAAGLEIGGDAGCSTTGMPAWCSLTTVMIYSSLNRPLRIVSVLLTDPSF